MRPSPSPDSKEDPRFTADLRVQAARISRSKEPLPVVSPRWRPPVVLLATDGTATPRKLTWQEEYVRGEAPLNFKVSLDDGNEYVPHYSFQSGGQGSALLASEGPRTDGPTPGELRAMRGDALGALVTWEAVKGSKVGDGLFHTFELPDDSGRVLRLYHTSNKRNARPPYAEPQAAPPDSLAALQALALPPSPPPPQPSKRDLPRLAQSIFLAAAQPEQHTLAVASDEVWYGTLARDEIVLGAMQVDPPPETESIEIFVEEIRAPPEEEGPLDLDKSIFKERKHDSDSRSYRCRGPALMQRAFEIDWSRCNTERFRNFVSREDDATGDGELDAELAELKTALKDNCGLIYSVFTYYCAIGATADRYVMGLPEYHMLLRDLEISDPSSKGCKPADLENIFISTNVEDATRGAPSQAQKALNSANLDKALMRFEFLQAIVRLAIAKYLKGGVVHDASEAVEKLLGEDFELLPPEARHDPEEFREARLYRRDTHNAFAAHEKNLRGIFEFYSLGDDQAGATSAGRRLSLQEWECCMTDCHLYDSPHFTRNEAALCFIWSQPFVTDEVKRRLKLTHLTFVDFLEALARACTFKPLPTEAELRECKALTVPHFYQQGGSAMLKGIDWRDEERS